MPFPILFRKAARHAPLILAVTWTTACSSPAEDRTERSSRVMTAPRVPVTRPAALHRVVHVKDGDSLTLESDGVIHEVRLSGIDAPELSQDHGHAAKAALAEMVRGKRVAFTDSGQDSYHRNLVHLYVDGVDVNMHMVIRGLAWHYRAYSQDPRLAAAEQDARAHRRGLWSQRDPVPPWAWRRHRSN